MVVCLSVLAVVSPAISWRPIQGVPISRLKVAGIDCVQDKRLEDGWMDILAH